MLLLLLGSASCHSPSKPIEDRSKVTTYVLQPAYAKGFRIVLEQDHEILEIMDPWNHHQVLNRLLIVRSDSERSLTTEPDNTIKVPVKQFITLSSTQWGMLLQLGAAQHIAGITEAPFVQNPEMQRMLERGEVAEVGRDGFFKYELLSTFSGAVMLYFPDAAGLPVPMQALPLTLLPWPDYTEPHPLGRAEWLRLIGFLIDKQPLADSIFDSIASAYSKLSELAQSAGSRPSIFSDKLFAGQWYVPGGNSYIAKIMEDAGAEYIFRDINASGSVPLDPEAILARAANADYWRIPHAGDIGGYQGLLAENAIYGKFSAFRKRQIILCNTRESAYFEQGPLEPHILLADFIAIFHPEILPGHKPRYHQLMR